MRGVANASVDSIRNLVYNPETIAAIPQKDRKYLLAALQRLEKKSTAADFSLAGAIIHDYSFRLPLKTTLIEKIENKWKNLFSDRITSKKLHDQVKLTGGELFFRQGMELLHSDRKKGIELLEEAYHLGHPKAAFQLGKLAEDPKLRVKFYKKAAEKGLPEAQYELGLHYEARIPKNVSGQGGWKGGTARNFSLTQPQQKASRWYERAALNGHVDGMFRHGQLHARVPLMQTIWLIRAANRGHPQAQLMTGLYLMAFPDPEKIVEPRYADSAELYLHDVVNNPKATESDKADAYFLIAMIDLHHKRDRKAFEENVIKAAQLGCIEAQIMAAYVDEAHTDIWINGLKALSPLEVHPERFGFDKHQSALSQYIYKTILGDYLQGLRLITFEKREQFEAFGNSFGYPKLDPIQFEEGIW